jgi:hypothetical protein
MFSGRNLLVATKHHKESVIAPVLEQALGVKCLLAPDLDTDKLGTFTGEIERKDDPITTARNKCLLAMEFTDCDMAIASEGSFGPHPSIYFVPSDDEFLLFMDKRNNLEIIARELSTDTNFSGATVRDKKELYEFAQAVKFPSHGLIVKKAKHDFTGIEKGITDENKLVEVFDHFMKLHGSVYVETDMRAMYNPTRMKVIGKAAIKLADKINSLCPECATPGFDVTFAKPGLPCELCGFPTQSTFSFLYTCVKCGYTKEEKYPNGKQTEDPMHCDLCNP